MRHRSQLSIASFAILLACQAPPSAAEPGVVSGAEVSAAPSAPPASADGTETADASLPPGAFDAVAFALEHPSFDTFWYQGLAELDRYELTQSRYGEQHPGEAVLIYVTEDFLADVQVKYEFGDPSHAVPVFKLNAYRRFYTGVYPYSLLTSVFTPVDTPSAAPLKVSGSVQEWCGTTYQQFNRRGTRYAMTLRSYFQREGDQDSEVVGVLEDGLWARARIDPSSLPVGDLDLVPPVHVLRMAHLDTVALPADAALIPVSETPYGEVEAWRYSIRYTGTQRGVDLWIERAFPHRILAWEESGGPGGAQLTTAVLTHSLMLDYWAHHGADDGAYRDALGLQW